MFERRRRHGRDPEEEREADLPGQAPDRALSHETTEAEAIFGLQASVGNAAVRSLLGGAGAGGGAGTGGRGGSGGGGAALQLQRLLDNDDEDDQGNQGDSSHPDAGTDNASAEPDTADANASDGTDTTNGSDTVGAIDQVETQAETDLDPGTVIDSLAPYAASDDGGMGDYEAPGGDTVQALAIQRDPADPTPEPTRPGTPGDVLKALMPFLAPALERLKANVLEALKGLKTGEKIAAAIVIAPIVLAPLTQPGPRRLALDQLDGTDVTFGVIPNLKIAPIITDGQLRGGTATYDLAPLLRSAGVPF